MAYTPISWQTVDTITAEKMNKMDNGWGEQNTQLFSETVTTQSSGGFCMAELSYSNLIDYDAIAVTFSGTEYTCPRFEHSGSYYGGVTEQGLDFSEYPFVIQSMSKNPNRIYTQQAGTYTVSVSAPFMETSEAFDSAVAHAEGFAVVSGVTTFQDAVDAFKSGKRVYVADSQNNKTYHQPIILINESTYEIKFVTTSNSDTSIMLSGLSASSADGVLS